jgi:very-short-patch-repair endonuclease
MHCTECGCPLSAYVSNYSTVTFGLPLCVEHQRWIERASEFSTDEAIRLYFALKQRGVPAQLEKYDGHKHIDIAIPEAKVNIEVDGSHHHHNPQQALADLKRTYYSFLKGYHTIHIPNSLVLDESILNETADYVVAFLNESLNKHWQKPF